MCVVSRVRHTIILAATVSQVDLIETDQHWFISLAYSIRPAPPCALAPLLKLINPSLSNIYQGWPVKEAGLPASCKLVRECAIDQDMSGLRSYQDRDQTVRPHVVGIAVNAEGLLRQLMLKKKLMLFAAFLMS